MSCSHDHINRPMPCHAHKLYQLRDVLFKTSPNKIHACSLVVLMHQSISIGRTFILESQSTNDSIVGKWQPILS